MKSEQVKLIIGVILVGSIGLGLGYLIGSIEGLSQYLPSKEDISLWHIILLIPILFFTLAIHELGHLLTGLFFGFRFELFATGPLTIQRNEEDRIRLSFTKELQFWGGIAATSPRAAIKEIPRKMALVIIAGPISSLLLAFACFIISPNVEQPTSFFLLSAGFVSGAIFLATTLPSRSGAFYTDRKRFSRLMNPGLEREIELALIEANTSKIQGKSIRQIDLEKLKKLTEDRSPMFKYLGYYYLYEYFQESPEEIQKIQTHMADLEEKIPKVMVNQMKKEMEKIDSST